MSSNFLFNAPTYLDFNLDGKNEEGVDAETYFDVDHESITKIMKYPEVSTSEGACSDKPNNNLRKSTSLMCLCPEEEAIAEDCVEICDETRPPKLRKSLSVGNLIQLEEDLVESTRQHLKIDGDFDNYSTKNSWSDRLNMLAQPKHTAHPKYVSTAEQINKFYGTPTRFHSWQRKLVHPDKQNIPHSRIMPESPRLATKLRCRNNNALSRDEIEKQEMEEFKRFKIKARPVNKKILHGPVKPVAIPRKPATIVKPFHLSENPPKKTENASEILECYEFHARPVPKAVYEKSHSETKLLQKQEQQKQSVKQFGSKEKLNIEATKSSSLEKSFRPTQTQPMPFSFERRDRLVAKRREDMISKVLEEEKRAREFRANPPPKFINKKSASLNSLKTIKECDSKDQSVLFKANPPTVLYQKPFEPKKNERTLAEVTEVCLNTDRRAKEREEFEKKLLEKKEQLAYIKLQREAEQIRLREEEINEYKIKSIKKSIFSST